MTNAKDLTKESPRSPRTRIHDYVIIARMIDKGRATLAGKVGEYHFDCPLDNMLFGFKGVKGEDVKEIIKSGATDEQVAEWIDTHGTKKTAEEIKAWADGLEKLSLYNDPEKGEWFAEQCRGLGLNPEKSTLFDMLEADDIASYKK